MFAVALSRECFLFLEPKKKKKRKPRRLGTGMRYRSNLSLYENLLQSIEIDGRTFVVIGIAPVKTLANMKSWYWDIKTQPIQDYKVALVILKVATRNA